MTDDPAAKLAELCDRLQGASERHTEADFAIADAMTTKRRQRSIMQTTWHEIMMLCAAHDLAVPAYRYGRFLEGDDQ